MTPIGGDRCRLTSPTTVSLLSLAIVYCRCHSLLCCCLHFCQKGVQSALGLLSELHRQFCRPLHVAFVDIESAFDSVDRNALWKVLRARGIPDILLHLIEDLHTHTGATVRIGNKFSCRFCHNIRCSSGMCPSSSAVPRRYRLDTESPDTRCGHHCWTAPLH